MKVPPKRKGNDGAESGGYPAGNASMKVPPKRKGNSEPGDTAQPRSEWPQ